MPTSALIGRMTKKLQVGQLLPTQIPGAPSRPVGCRLFYKADDRAKSAVP